MEKSVYKYVWRYSRPQQVALTLMSAAALPFLYLFYEITIWLVRWILRK